MKIKFNNKLPLFLALFFTLVIFTACTTASSEGEMEGEMGKTDEMDQGNMDEMDHDMEGMEHDVARIPNEGGAAISILSPEDGSTAQFGEQIIVEVAVENFDLGDEGKHWHIYIDGNSWGMVMGQNTEQALTGIDPGEHEIAVYMSIESHEEYEDGDQIHIVVEE